MGRRDGENAVPTLMGIAKPSVNAHAITTKSTGSSWTRNAARIASASASHRRVDPSISVNRNVTTPEGAPPSRHFLGPPHRPVEAEVSGHRAVAIPIVAIAGLVAMCPRQQRAQPQHDRLSE